MFAIINNILGHHLFLCYLLYTKAIEGHFEATIFLPINAARLRSWWQTGTCILNQGCTKPGRLVPVVTKFLMAAPNIWKFSVRIFLHVTRILIWLLKFWKVCASLYGTKRCSGTDIYRHLWCSFNKSGVCHTEWFPLLSLTVTLLPTCDYPTTHITAE